MANIYSPTYLEIASCTRLAILARYHDALLQWGRTLDLNFEASFAKQDGYFSSFLPVMASNHTSITIRELLSRIAKFISCRLCAWALEHADSGQGQNFTPIKLTSSNIGAYFLATESDKCMHLLTRLYGMLQMGIECTHSLNVEYLPLKLGWSLSIIFF